MLGLSSFHEIFFLIDAFNCATQIFSIQKVLVEKAHREVIGDIVNALFLLYRVRELVRESQIYRSRYTDRAIAVLF